MSELSEDYSALIERAEKRIHDFIIVRLPSGNGIATFLSMILKEPSFDIPTAVTASTRHGAIFYYNPSFILSLSDPELMFVATHEFVHLALNTFARSEQIKSGMVISDTVYNRKIAPYFDVIVNNMLLDMPGMALIQDKMLVLSQNSPEGLVPQFMRTSRTLEQLAISIYNNLQRVQEIDAPEITFVNERSDANESDLRDINYVLNRSIKQDDGSSLPGSVSRLINDLAPISTREQKRTAKSIWNQLSQSIRQTRAAVLQRKRSMRRINRRTLLPPGRVFDKGFHALFLLDESGSVNDTFIAFAFEMIEGAALGDKADKISVAHWDTKLVKLETISKGEKPDLKRVARGGTAFDTIYTEHELRKLNPDICIVVTDGECSQWPKGRIPYPTVWVINTDYGMKTWKRLCNTGNAIYIPKDMMK